MCKIWPETFKQVRGTSVVNISAGCPEGAALVKTQTFRRLVSYGLLIMRNIGSIAVEVQIDKEKVLTVNILWISSAYHNLGREISFLISKIQ